MSDKKIAIIGLGYVGLPLAVEFGRIYDVVGFDIDLNRINELRNGIDRTLETTSEQIARSKKLVFTGNLSDIKNCNIYIVTVPTPIDTYNNPDLTILKESSKMVGKNISNGDIVIYESTVFPGATEEMCVPILEKESGLEFNKNFYCGYSPERINPGDKDHNVTSIKKVTSGSTKGVALLIDNLYKDIIVAGTYMAESIKVAEAAKVIENTQRDLNIALINELSIIFNKLDIDTEEVLRAAETKWNFVSFRPGLVGGHCIGVDPYYLTQKAIQVGYRPEVILSGRRVNSGMGGYIAEQVFKIMSNKNISIINSNILIMGLTFKENCPDLRNTRVIDMINKFNEFNCNVSVYEPIADNNEAQNEYDLDLIDYPENGKYDAIVLAVSHKEFKNMGFDKISSFGKDTFVLYDVKCILDKEQSDGRL